MKKKIMFLTLTAFITLLMFSIGTKTLKAADLGDVDVLIANPGEDSSTQMNFSFHTNVSGVVVEVAKKSDGNFDKAIKITPECIPHAEAYPLEGTNWGVDYGKNVDRKTMNVCEAYATGLDPDTEYMYRVGATKFSETRYFKTADDDGVFAFAVMADPQVYGSGVAVTSNNTMNRALKKAETLNMDLEVVLSCGDQSNTGGIMNEWRWLYDGHDIYKQLPLISCIGNHDALDAAGGYIQTGSYVFDSVVNSPKNGPETNSEGVYYVVWNNVLFVVLDSEVSDNNYKLQMNWFKEVVETVPHQYLVVMYHRACWGSSAEAAEFWYPTFEEYGIDLSFSGDNHDYGRGSTKVGAERGQAKFPGHYVVCDDSRNASNADKTLLGGYILVQVTKENLQYYAYDVNDTLIDQCVFVAKRPYEASEDFNKASFMDSVKIEVVETDSKKAKLSWQKDSVGNVKFITLKDASGKVVKNIFNHNVNVVDYVFGGLKANTDYPGYKVEVEFEDGTKETKEISFRTEIDYGKYNGITSKELSTTIRLILDPTNIKGKLFEKVNVYVNGELKTSIEPTAKFAALEKAWVTGTEKVELKGVVEMFLEKVGLKGFKEYDAKSARPYLHPGRQANIMYDGELIGYLGEVHPEVADNYDIGTKAYIAVLDMPKVVEKSTFDIKYEGIAKFPAVTRDLSLVMKKEVLAGDVEAVIRKASGKLLETYSLFDIYEGSQIEEGYKSLAYSIVFRAKDRTLEEKDITEVMQKILKKLSEVEGIHWIRTLYTYPDRITDELLDTIAGNEKLVKYLDIPLQHVSTKILKAIIS